jgi:transposase
MSQSEFAAYVAIDWADWKHYWQLTGSDGQHREQGHLLNTPEAIDTWVAGLLTRFSDGSVAVCLEQSRGALAYQLCKYGRLVLYPVHPAAMASFRQAFFPSGAKGDPSDAGLLLEILLHHRQRLRRLDPDTTETRLLQMLIELRRKLVDERTRESNRLTAWLKMYFPQALDWIDNIDSPLGCDFLERWPTLQQLQRAHAETIERFFREHNSRSQARIDERVAAIRQALPAVHDTALLQAGAAASTSLVALLKALNGAIASLDPLIAEQVPKHPEAHLFAELPGAGPVLLPRLIVAFGTRRERFQSASELAAYSGIAPVTKQSGKSKTVHFRFACPKFLRQTFHEFAAHSIARSQWARQFYQQQRDRGMRHHAAVRALAFKWIRVLFRCWKDRTPYNEARYLQALELRRAPRIPPSDPAPAAEGAGVTDKATPVESAERSE